MKIDIHNHVCRDLDALLQAGDRLGIDLFCCAFGPAASSRITRGNPDPEAVRASNDEVVAAVRAHPKRIVGWCYVNPGYLRESLEEMDRCIRDEGLIGVKLYNQYFMDEPVLFPIVERTVAWGVPLLIHAGRPCRAQDRAAQPRISDGTHIAGLARRFPEAMIIEGHIGGGGDWEWSLKAIASVPNVFLDTSGSVIDAGMVDRCLAAIGHERLLFGTDMSYEEGVGKILGSDLSEEQREDVFWRNALRIFERRKV